MATERFLTCPVSGERVDHLVTELHSEYDARLIAMIRRDRASWHPADGICSHQLDYYYLKLRYEGQHLVTETRGNLFETAYDIPIPPTWRRLNAHPDYTGKGVTICVIDSGFYPLADFERPENRILKMVDITHPERTPAYFRRVYQHSWHGAMTSAVCAGNGALSGGYFRGLASDANLVLLKVQDRGRITTDHIVEAIEWAIEHRDIYKIRIINLSLSDDWAISYKDSRVAQAAETAIEDGISVVAAIGNNPAAAIKPPANSPNVISVGGLNDHNTLGTLDDSMYNSTYGHTVDGYLKPELIAPAIWIAAPILPDTAAARQAQALERILAANDSELGEVFYANLEEAGLQEDDFDSWGVEGVRAAVRKRIRREKFIAANYMHVDGTSFAAPIISAIIAQMLEANPDLTPAMIRELLINSAKTLPHIPVEQQGHGVVDALEAVVAAEKENHQLGVHRQQAPFINHAAQQVTFFLHDHHAQKVVITGDFIGWTSNGVVLQQKEPGLWETDIPLPPNGFYRYKFIINDQFWVSDPRNPFREPDGFNGMNSTFRI